MCISDTLHAELEGRSAAAEQDAKEAQLRTVAGHAYECRLLTGDQAERTPEQGGQ